MEAKPAREAVVEAAAQETAVGVAESAREAVVEDRFPNGAAKMILPRVQNQYQNCQA